MAQVLSLISPKGGVGKSTTAINLSAALADMGLRVLVIDLDPQQSITKFFKYPEPPTAGLQEFIVQKDVSVIVKTHIKNLDCVVNNDPKEKLNQWMTEKFAGNYALKTVLKRVREKYDIIIIDTQGKDGRGQLQEMALIAADVVVTPTTPDVMSSQEIHRAIKIFNEFFDGLEEMEVSTKTPTLKILINREDHTAETKKVTTAIRNGFGNIARHITVLKTMIPSRVVYRNCISEKIPAHRLERKRTENGREAIEIMESLIHEILPHYQDLTLTAEVDNDR